MSEVKVDKISPADSSANTTQIGDSGDTISLPSGVTLTVASGLGAASGGTGLTGFTAGDLLYATGTTTLVKLAKGTAGQTLQMNGGASAPTWVSVSAGTTTDLNQVRMGRNDVPTGTSFDLLDATTLAINKANKVYISNRSTDETYYIILIIDAKVIGRLYGGDWMFIPWNCDDATHDLEVTAYTGTNTIEWACFHEGETLPTQGD